MTDTALLQEILRRVDRIEKTIRPAHSTWLTEAEVMKLTNLCKRSLLRLRKAGIINWGTASGRKIRYYRKDVDKFLNENSTLKS